MSGLWTPPAAEPGAFRDLIRCAVNVEITKRNVHTGRVREVVRTHNLVVTAGLNLIRDSLFNNGTRPAQLGWFAVGTGSVAPAGTDTALGTEVFRDTFTQLTVADGQETMQYYLASGSANGYTLTEAGAFNASTAGTMYARVTFAGDAKTSAEEWTFNWIFSYGV